MLAPFHKRKHFNHIHKKEKEVSKRCELLLQSSEHFCSIYDQYFNYQCHIRLQHDTNKNRS